MKYFKLTLCSLAIASSVQAIEVQMSQEIVNDTQSKSEPVSATSYGIYQVETNLTTVPKSLAANQKVVADVNGLSIVSLAGKQLPQVVQKGSVLRNVITGEYAIASGNITVLVKESEQISVLAEKYSLSVDKNFSNTNLVIFNAADGVDLVDLITRLKSDAMIKEARLDIQDNLNKPL